MTKTYKPAQPFTDGPRPPIPLIAIPEERSSQIGAVGYDAESLTLAVQFRHGVGAIYHYRGIPQTGVAPSHEGLMVAESMGVYHRDHLKQLTFEKYHAETAVTA
jgi:hypothetical protein